MCAALLLTGCSAGSKSAAVGEPLEVKIRQSDIDAKAQVTVTDVESVPTAEVQEALQLPDSFIDGTVFFAHYDAQLTEGEYPSDDGYGFGHHNWQARGVDEVEISTVQIFQQPDVENCELFATTSSELPVDLAAGEKITACSIFVSAEADAKIESIVYGQKSVSRRGSGDGWMWTVTS